MNTNKPSHRKTEIKFPCTFPVKAIGLNTLDLVAHITTIIRRHAPELTDQSVTSRHSGGGKYLAVTATIIATSLEQLDALYQDLNGDERVIMTL